MKFSLRSLALSLGCAALCTGMAAAQDGGFVDDSSAAPTSAVSTAPSSAAPVAAPSVPAQPPAKVGIAQIPGVTVPKPGQPLDPTTLANSSRTAVRVLTPKLGLSSYEQNRIASTLNGTLSQANSMCSAHGDTAAASQDQLNSLYATGLNQVEGVLSDPQKQILQKMLASMAPAPVPGSNLSLTAAQQSQVQTIAQSQHQAMQAVMSNTSLTQQEKMAQIQQIHQQSQAQINEILTPEQQTQLQQLAQSRQGAQPTSNTGSTGN